MSEHTYLWRDEPITRQHLLSALRSSTIAMEDNIWAKVEKCRDYLEEALRRSQGVYYGINTGFGALCDIKIDDEALSDLQHNLIMSHSCGTGAEVPDRIARVILLLKILSLSRGHSGIRRELLERLIDFYNHQLHPIIYEQGSLGASGDLAPLAHLSLPIIGLGAVRHHGKTVSADAAHVILQGKPMRLAAKEGLALLNGTQFSTAYALDALLRGLRLMNFAHATTALSIEAFNCSPAPLDPLIHHARNQAGQIQSAQQLRRWLTGSDIGFRQRYAVQDPYAFRCAPQVMGATMDTLIHAEQVIMSEINGVTDNPNIFPDQDKILSGGNFHAQPLAYINDFMAIAMSEVASISERRTYQLIHGLRDLPAFLTPKAGMHSGLMISQYTAASIVSQNKQLCTPASVDSIPSSAGQEDHVSMAANAGTKLMHVIDNVETVLCIEWMTAAQAMSFREGYRLGVDLQSLVDLYHKTYVPKLTVDRVLRSDIEQTRAFYREQFKLES